jgi:hypothetical protein
MRKTTSMRLPTIAAILKNHPSSDDDCLHLSIENPPYMRLVIEDIGLGPKRSASNSTGMAPRKQLEIFAARWDKNIGEQGFLKAVNAGEPSAS